MFRNFKFLVAVILVVAIEAAGINYLGRHNILPEGSEHWTEDWLIHYFSKREKAPNKDIVLVLINDETLEKEKLGPSLPVDRGWMAKLVKAADDAHPKAMAFDFYYASPIDPAKDEQLVSELRNARAPIVLAALDSTSLTTETQRQFLKDFIKRTGRVSGHIYIKQSNEVLLSGDRAARLIDHEPSKDGYPSFVSAIANLPAVIETYGKRTIPEGPQRIDWLLPPEKGNTFERISAYQIMSGDPVILDKLKNKIVLIGPDFPNADRHFVPFTVGEQVKYPGLFVHAQALAQILDNRFFYNWTGAGEFLLLFSIGLFGALIGAAFHGHWLAVGLGVIGSLVAIGASIPLFMIHIALPTALVILIWVTALPTGSISRRISFRNHLHEKGSFLMNKKIFIVAGSLLVPFIFAFASQAAEDQPSDAKASNKAEHDKKAAKKAKKAAPSVKSSAPTSRSVSPPSDGATSDDPVGGMPGHNSGSDQKQP